MDNINKPDKDNLGGINKFWLVLKDDITEIACDAVEPGYRLVLDPSGTIYYIYGTPDTIIFTESKNTDFNGDHYACTLEAICPNNQNAIQRIFDEIDTKEFVIVLMDNNGNYKLFGEIDESLTFINNYSSTPNFSGLNANRIVFSRKMKKRSRFIINPFT